MIRRPPLHTAALAALLALTAAAAVAHHQRQRQGLECVASPAPGPVGPGSIRCRGLWRASADLAGRFDVKSAGHLTLRVDERELPLASVGRGARRRSDPVTVPAGLHHLEVTYRPAAGDPGRPPRLRFLDRRTGTLREVAPLYAVRSGAIARGLSAASPWLLGLAAAAWLGLAGLTAWNRRHDGRVPRRVRRAAVIGAALMVTVLGAGLRLEALVKRYWPGAPAWAVAASDTVERLRPGGPWALEPEPYAGTDAFNYLRGAREERGFYDADPGEPLFMMATRPFLRLASGADAGISLASASFSTLTLPATVLLGAALGSPAAGLAAALLLAVERQVVAVSVEGGRDDLFALLAVVCAALLLRLRERPRFAAAVALGLAGGLACLTRLTALSFLVPGLAAVALLPAPSPPRVRWKAVALVGALIAAVAGPFLLACALRYGDPLYAVNYHTAFYRARAGLDASAPAGWLEYLLGSGRGPLRLLDTLLIGLFEYPFARKWQGFQEWAGWLGPTLAWLAGAGLALLALRGTGRLLLLVFFAALVPFAFTFHVPGGDAWRLTLFAYPFYLAAAAVSVGTVVGWGREAARAPRAAERGLVAARLAALALVAVAAVPAVRWGVAAVRYAAVAEDLRAGRSALLQAGPRDRLFMGEGWYPPVRQGNLSVRYSREGRAELRLPLAPTPEGYQVLARLDPFMFLDAPPQSVAVALNGMPVAVLPLSWDPRRVGTYALRLPPEAVRPGENRLVLTARYSTAAAAVEGGEQELEGDWRTAFLLWYLRLAPAGGATASVEGS